MTSTELAEELDRLQEAIGDAQRILAGLQARMQAVANEHERRTRKAPEPRLSDHALLRYLERAKGVDVEAAKREILTPTVCAAVQAGCSGITVNGIRFVVNGGTIVTTLEPTQRFKNKTKRGHLVEVEE